jgi:predicted TIM-barrel fold metal-dependent hydrolase
MLPQQAIMVKENRIDTRAHVFAASCAIAPGARYRPLGEAPVGEWLALQDAAGVTHGVLVQPSFLGTDTSCLLETLRVQPQRLRATVVVGPGIPPGDAQTMGCAGRARYTPEHHRARKSGRIRKARMESLVQTPGRSGLARGSP